MLEQDERGVARGYGSPIAWFKDPAGNIPVGDPDRLRWALPARHRCDS